WRFVPERALEALAQQGIGRRQEGGERLPRAGRRRDQGVTARLNDGPRAPLRFGGLREPVAEPARDRRVKAGEWHRRNMAKISRNWIGHSDEQDHPSLSDHD